SSRPSRSKIHRCPLWSKSGQTRPRLECPLCARSRLMHCNKQQFYSSTSVARTTGILNDFSGCRHYPHLVINLDHALGLTDGALNHVSNFVISNYSIEKHFSGIDRYLE